MSEPTSNTVLLQDVRFSYLHAFEPTQVAGKGEAKYSVTALIPKEGKYAEKNKAALDEVIARLEAEVKALPASKGKLPKKWDVCLRDGDKDADEKGADYEGHWYVSAKSKTKPGVVSTEKDADGKFKKLGPTEIKSGDHGRVTINFFSYDTAGNQGIGAGLNNIQKTRDGVSLAGARSADTDFDGLEDEEDDDLDGLG